MAGALAHWLALIDIADPAPRSQRGASLASVEELALRGRFTPDGLHRLATVLDALDYHVPMRLWEAASRSAAADHRASAADGRTVRTAGCCQAQGPAVRPWLLVFQTLGPQGRKART